MNKILIFKLILNYPDGGYGLDCIPDILDKIHTYSMIEDSITKTYYKYKNNKDNGIAPDFWIEFYVSVHVDTEDMNSEYSLFKYGVLDWVRENTMTSNFSYDCYLVDDYKVDNNIFSFNKKKAEKIDFDKAEVRDED